MFNKKVTAAAIMTAAMAAFAATGVFAESVDKVDVEGVKFEIPAEFKDLLTVTTEGLEDGTLVSVSETASIEAAKANGSSENQIESAGWLFSISRISEDEMKNIRCGMTDGQEIFAEGEDVYYVFNHPTDVRLIREQYDDIDEDLAQWSRLNEWANDAVCGEIVLNNPELEAENYSYTQLDSRLCKILYNKDGVKYEIHNLKYPDLDASTFKDDDYIEELTEDVIYYSVPEKKNADGETIVLNFPEENVRYEFLTSDEFRNTIREVVTSDGNEYIYYYEAEFEDPDKTAADIMEDWCDAISKGDADSDDDVED